MSEELKSCPFCGSLAVVKSRVDSDWGVDLEYRLLNDESNYEIKSMIADENYNPDYHTGDYYDIEIYRCQSCRAEWGVGTDVCIAELHARIAELEAEIDQLTAHDATERQDDKWIPVSERLPDNWKPVLTIDISKSTRDMVTAFYNPETSLWSTHFSCDLWVTHWMPLPEPPIMYGKVCD